MMAGMMASSSSLHLARQALRSLGGNVLSSYTGMGARVGPIARGEGAYAGVPRAMMVTWAASTRIVSGACAGAGGGGSGAVGRGVWRNLSSSAGLAIPRAGLDFGRGAARGVAGAEGLVRGGDVARSQIGWWLAGCTGWVFSMVVLGGVTRLTRSGLSMTEWKFVGTLPPLTPEEWDVEFDKYRASPEFKRCNSSMNLEEFKFIYWMEYAHRMWGRGLGLAFGLPCAFFAYRGYITPALALPLGALFAAGACQGLIGWWMVKSGLNEPLHHYDVPRVSPYRLATHLTSAFAIYTGLLWTTLSVAFPQSPAALASTEAVRSGAIKLRGLVLPLTALIGITAVSGAFVAGLDAGHAYNTFPLMGGQLVPEEILRLEPLWKNFFENTATVQFDHRVLAMSTLCSVSAVWMLSRRLPLPQPTSALLHALLGVTCCQVSLGILTLLNHVPVSLGSAHQAGALTLFSTAVALLHTIRK